MNLRNIYGDIRDTIRWWKRKDVSLLFKFLNTLSRDHLRNFLSFVGLDIYSVERDLEDLIKEGLLTEEHAIYIKWHLESLRRNYDDVWAI